MAALSTAVQAAPDIGTPANSAAELQIPVVGGEGGVAVGVGVGITVGVGVGAMVGVGVGTGVGVGVGGAPPALKTLNSLMLIQTPV